MRLEQDNQGRIRVAKGDKKSRGGQYAKSSNLIPKHSVMVPVLNVEENEGLTLAEYNEYEEYDITGDRLSANRKAYVAFGAHQPFTKAHQQIAELGYRKAASDDAEFIQFTTAAFGKTSKHVLPSELKTQLIIEAIGVKPEVVQGPFQMFEHLALNGYSTVYLLLGEDRSKEAVFVRAAEEYGVELHIISIPRPEGSISGTMAREYVKAEDYNGFKNTAASNVSDSLLETVYSVMSENIAANNSRKNNK